MEGGTIMSRLRELPLPEVDDEIKAVCADVERQAGTSRSTRVYAHHPPIVKALAGFRAAMATQSVLEPTIKELARLKIARLNACRY
jgi:alkylhydroperoxidase family enzyme